MKYKEIPIDEEGLLDLMDIPLLVVNQTWAHADIGMFDPFDLVWYSPTDGSEFFPAPTHYTEIPKFEI